MSESRFSTSTTSLSGLAIGEAKAPRKGRAKTASRAKSMVGVGGSKELHEDRERTKLDLGWAGRVAR